MLYTPKSHGVQFPVRAGTQVVGLSPGQGKFSRQLIDIHSHIDVSLSKIKVCP